MDLKKVGERPVVKTLKYLGRIPFETGFQQHIDTQLRIHHLTDQAQWVQFGQRAHYKFWKLRDYISARILNYGEDQPYLAIEWFTIDT